MYLSSAPRILPPIVDQNGQPIKISEMQLHLHTMLTPEDTEKQFHLNLIDGITNTSSKPVDSQHPSSLPQNSSVTTQISRVFHAINPHTRDSSKIPSPTKDKVCAHLFSNDQSSYNVCMNRLENLFSLPIVNSVSRPNPPMSAGDYQQQYHKCLQQAGNNIDNIRKCDHQVILGGNPTPSQQDTTTSAWW